MQSSMIFYFTNYFQPYTPLNYLYVYIYYSIITCEVVLLILIGQSFILR